MYPGLHAELTPDKPALIIAETGLTVSYAELDSESTRMARVFRDAGLRAGDSLAILMDNDHRYLSVCWAAQRSGLVYVPINWHLTIEEMRYIVDNSHAKAIVANDVCAQTARRLLQDCPALVGAFSIDASIVGFDDLVSAAAAQPAGPLEDESEGVDMIYSSGTTGQPKGGFRPSGGRPPRQFRLSSIDYFYGKFRFGPEMRMLTPGAPMYHGGPLRTSMVTTRYGGTNILMQRFDAEGALAAIERYGATHSHWVPTMLIRLLRLPEGIRSRYDTSSQQVVIHAAAPCPVEVKQQLIDWWGPIVHEFYAASEGGGVTYLDTEEWLAHRGSVGRPLLGRFHILDDEGNECPPRVPGTIYVEKGLPVQYFEDPEKTQRAHDPRGWVTVGDMGYLDEDGYLYLTDRKDHMIISGGVNIYPQEAEDVLIQHPAVADVAVIGVPHQEFGEEVKAVVELEPGRVATVQLEEELIGFCRDRLAAFKCPRSVDFVADLPRAPTGKLFKRQLRERYWAGHASAIV